MAFLVKNSVIINDQRELIGVNTAGINTALYVGPSISADAASGIVSATEFIGIGSQLRDIPGLSWVSTTAPATRPNTDALQDGDLYYDPVKLRQFTYYSGDGGNWRDSNPAANAALSYQVEGLTPGQVIPGEDTLKFESTVSNNIVLGVSTASDTITYDLASNVSIAGSMTAGTFYGDGSNLEGVGLGTDSNVETTGNIQAGIITATVRVDTANLNATGDAALSTLDVSGETTILSSGSLTVEADASTNINGPLQIVALNNPTGFSTFGEGGGGQVQIKHTGVGLTVTNDAFVGGTLTAGFLVGDGSGLSNIVGAAAVYNTVANDNEDDDLPMPFLSAVGAGASMYTDSTPDEQFTYNPFSGILKAKEFDALSDARLKTDIVEIEDALGKVADLRGVEYNWKNGSGASVGIIAQELQEVYPQLVSDNGERLTVNYNGLVGLLIAAVNELSTELQNLKESK